MRKYNDAIFDEIAREIAFIWSANRVHKLNGKMRLFTPKSVKDWTNNDPGIEIWFGPQDIPAIIKKLKLFYRDAKPPNSTYVLDPVVYSFADPSKPRPIGCGIVWATALCLDGKILDDDALKRIKDLGIFASFLHKGDNDRAGVKMLGYLKQSAKPKNLLINEKGGFIDGTQQLADIIDLSSEAEFSSHYLLSGLEYDGPHGTFQSISFQEMYGDEVFSSVDDILRKSVHQRHIVEAGTCWNAYNRDPFTYKLYGNDYTNLENNLASKAASDAMVGLIANEFDLIWDSNKRSGLEGKMRIYSSMHQDMWRSKVPGFEFFFDPTQTKEAALQIGKLYNAGKLPNTPVVLDPIVYQQAQDGQFLPVGYSIIWGTCISVGLESFTQEALDRIKEIGLMQGEVIRAGQDYSGLKLLGFLDEPYLFSPQEIAEYQAKYEDSVKAIEEEQKPDKDDEDELEESGDSSSKQEDSIDDVEVDESKDNIEQDDDTKSKIDAFDEALAADDGATEQVDNAQNICVLDSQKFSTCKSIFDITDCNGTEYWQTYIMTGMEYLCTNGSFANHAMCETFSDDEESRKTILEKYTIPRQRVIDAAKCWNGYDRLHELWQNFGIDTTNLKNNLKYYNLCGRDLELLKMTGDTREDDGEEFQFFAKGWVPKAAVTVLVATGGTGKSSLAHRLAVLASIDWRDDEPNPKFLGSEIDKENCKGLAVYLSGEDSAAIVKARADMIDPEGRSTRLLLKCSNDFEPNEDGSEGTLADFLHYLDKLPDVAICVIDPARKYLIGDEEDAEIVGDFFEAIEEFAVKKNCAMIVVHHMVKGAHPDDSRDMIDLLRGSQVFIDRPRVVIGLYRDNAYTVAGLAKNNIPPGLGMIEGERLFVRDPEHLDLFPVPGPEGIRSFTVSEEELKAIREEAEAKTAQLAESEIDAS